MKTVGPLLCGLWWWREEGARLDHLGVQRHVRAQHQADHRAPHEAVVLLWQHLPPQSRMRIASGSPGDRVESDRGRDAAKHILALHGKPLSCACQHRHVTGACGSQSACVAAVGSDSSLAHRRRRRDRVQAGAPRGSCWLACAAAGTPARRACSRSHCCHCTSAPPPHASAPGTRWTPLRARRRLACSSKLTCVHAARALLESPT